MNAKVLAPLQGLNGPGGILVKDGWILAVGKDVTRDSVGASATIMCRCKGHLLVPGLVDMRVFAGEPGSGIPRDAGQCIGCGSGGRCHHDHRHAEYATGDR